MHFLTLNNVLCQQKLDVTPEKKPDNIDDKE